MIFMHNISRKYSNQQIFQYSKKHKNLKEQRKTQRISWNEKRCSENAKILGEIHERNTQHDNKKKMQCCANGKESKGLASERGTYSSGWHTVKS